MRTIRTWGAVAALALAAAGCGGSQPGKGTSGETGRVTLSVKTSALSRAADVRTILVEMTSADGPWTTSALLAPGQDGGFAHTFEAVPAGRYRFHAQARDAAGVVLFETPSPYPEQPVVVPAGMTTTVTLLLQESNPPDPFHNHAPRFLTVTASERSLDAVRTVLLSATAVDPDGDPLTFTWSSSGGGAFGPQTDAGGASSTSWTPPGEGDFAIKVVAADGRGASAAFSISIHVAVGQATVVAIVDLNSAPVVTSLTAAELQVGQPVAVTAVASDVDGDPVAFGPWTATCQGTFSAPVNGVGPVAGSSSSATSFTVAAGQTSGDCTLTAHVSDGRGGSGSGSLTFSLETAQGGDDHSPRTLVVLETSDLHANLMPWNYFSASADQKVGLAKIATLVGQERAANPCTLLVDDGDTIQGTPLGTYYALIDQTARHPMAAAMSALRYDTMTAGNHEFNYGLATLARFRGDAAFPVLSANVRKKSDGSPAFTPYVVKTVCGVKVGILGLTTPGITTWDVENTRELIVDLPIDAAAKFVPEMRARGAEVIVVALHAGPDRAPTVSGDAGWLTDPAGWVDNGSMPHENDAIELAQQVPGIDAVLTGHTHLAIPKMLVGSTLLVQPNRWGSHLAEVKLGLDHASGSWAVKTRDSRLLAVDASVSPDPALVALVQPYHAATVAYVETPIGTAAAAFPGGDAARFTDSALADLINTVQMDAAARAGFPVDVSLAAIFNNTGMIPAGAVKLRDAYSAYIYDNTLYVVQVTGKVLRQALEQDARYFVTLDPANLPATAAGTKDPNARDYNWDLYSGIDTTIDLTRPVGSRVTRLQLRGADVTDDQVIRVAVNNYRAGGGGYGAFAGSPVLWKSQDGVRDYLAAYVAAHPGLDPAAINVCNFTLVPDLYARYFPGAPARCSAPVSGTALGATDLQPGESAALRVTAIDGVTPSPWTYTWSDGLAGAEQGAFAVTALPAGSEATYTPAACVDLGLGPHVITVTATAADPSTGRAFPVTFALTVECPGPATGPVAVKVLAINDFHGQIGAGKTVSSKPVGSAGVLAAYLRNAMAGMEARTVIAEAGDLVGASPADSALLQDEPAVAFFSLLGNAHCASMPPPAQQSSGPDRFDVLFDPLCNLVGVPGNHDFDEGVPELMRLLGGGNHPQGPFLSDPWPGARYPVVSANVRNLDGEPLFRPYVVKYLGGVQVGFIGATLATTPSIVLASSVAGLVFDDEIAAVNAQVKELQARGVHAIVVVLHDGVYQSGSYTGPTRASQAAPADLVALVSRLDADVDVLVSAHSHNFANEYVKNSGGKDVLVTQAYSAGTAFASIDLTVDGATQDVTAASASIVSTYADAVTPDPEAAALTAAADAMVAPRVKAQVGTATAIFPKSQNAAGESALGDLLAEAHRVAMGADFGITNPGGMRADLPASCTAAGACVITWGDCFTTQPFANQVMRVTLTGQQLQDALEQQFAGWNGQTQTRMLQISGFTYAWSGAAALGSKVVPGSLRKADGTAIDPAASYTVAMNNFLQGGGDGFSVLAGGTGVVPGPIDLDALLAYLKLQPGALTPATDGRVTKAP